MKIISSSPYSPFNPKEWNSVPLNRNHRISNNPIKIKKKYFKTFKKIEAIEIILENKDQPIHMQLAFA